MALFAQSNGIHFKDPWLLQPYTATATSVEIVDTGGVNRDSATVAFWTEFAGLGLQDTTNWTADTYKTLLTVSSGKGLVGTLIGPTADGSSTTTFEFTLDGGSPLEIAVSGLASGQRAVLTAAGLIQSGPAATTTPGLPNGAALAANKQIFAEAPNTASLVGTHQFMASFGVPQLRFNQSLLIRAKHSASITNSTATAYSGVMYRLGL